VGGGPVAARKVDGLAGAGAAITAVAPVAVAAIAAAEAAGTLTWRRREFREEDLEGQVLAFAATSDSGVNRAVAQAARLRGVWVNRADDPADCDFHVPAALRRGPVTVAVATDGASPVLAAWLRDRVGERLPLELATLAELVGALRQQTRADTGAFRGLFAAGILEDLGREDWPAVERKVRTHFGEGEAVRGILRGLHPEGR
ncbi:MAG: bifunctional precorrin-2 dehydrogenase/sirohydrochlorin ferrochelatase, partial [Deferrisomatales bacterium]|nr:bifunctional precorrin-2 dehydrogenase/sirohydrochlorin ferrochelatase [Deferrisomatales bacterium]